MARNQLDRKQTIGWVSTALIAVMVLVGGATRLTESGLSIVEWKPVTGTLPPLNEAQWVQAFEGYKAIPQYRELNAGMSLAEFKTIFWWEWSHRLLGRVIGAAYLLPFLYFLWRGALGGLGQFELQRVLRRPTRVVVRALRQRHTRECAHRQSENEKPERFRHVSLLVEPQRQGTRASPSKYVPKRDEIRLPGDGPRPFQAERCAGSVSVRDR